MIRDGKRRELIKAGLAASALLLPVPYARVRAQDAREGALKLLKAPKVALVVGNSKYRDAPELKNPGNDARGISEALKAAGFTVNMKLETGREELINAIREYVHLLEKQKAVGLFYFAGHGVQLDWRNYMLPVDAVIDRIEDVARQSVDIARLMEGLTKAANPMNIILLDACRENPFGEAKQPAQKGLSQMDAPINTVLAYATSPGNVASDGDGANGLYTENLLREMKVPEAKVEDVFKRVRLGVRRASRGAQIPWESTSLEDDFWFLPPKELKKISDEERDRRYQAELAEWRAVDGGQAPGPLEDYLRRHPSGHFAELAQLQLDALLARQGEKRIALALSAGNPYTKGTESDALIGPRPGYSRTVRWQEFSSTEGNSQGAGTLTIVKVTDLEVHWDNGLVEDVLGNTRRTPKGYTHPGMQNMPLEYSVGKRWTTRYERTDARGRISPREIFYRVAAREPLTVAAGTFNAFRIEGHGERWFVGSRGRDEMKIVYWISPGAVRGMLLFEEKISGARGSWGARRELIAFKG